MLRASTIASNLARASVSAKPNARVSRAAFQRTVRGAGSLNDDPEAAQGLDAQLIKTMSELAKQRKENAGTSAPGQGNTGSTTVMVGADTDEKWKELDAKVNEYPSMRKFQAIGADEEGFVDDIVTLISNALGGRVIHPENVTTRPSSKGKYVSANVIAEMLSGDDVLSVYQALKSDKRIKWFL